MKALILLALLAACTLAGCSSEPNAPKIPEQAADGAYIIHIVAGNHFSPSDAKVPANATVRWVNDSTSAHDVTDSDHNPVEWSSDMAAPQGLGHKMGESAMFDKQFVTPGVYHYQCEIHAGTGMTATLTVG